MSRCYSCDARLTEQELVRKSPTTGQYLDLCNTCYKEIEYIFIEQEEKEEQKPLTKEK